MLGKLSLQSIFHDLTHFFVSDQIKHVIEMGEVFSRFHYKRMMATFDSLDASKPCVKM